jgi:hypothetical protein
MSFIFFEVFIYSCNRNSKPNTSNATKDSVLSGFFKMVDTLPYYDTNNIDFKFLKAYKNNDTLGLTSIINYIQVRNVKPWMNSYLKPCAKNQEFDTLKADEAYRFVYESSFCPYFTVVTIIQTGDKIKATAIVYENASLMDSIPCTIAQQNEVMLDSISWEKFQDNILATDFWGLKEDNDYHGVDGSSLDVLGYQKSYRGLGERRSYVTRWSRSMDRLLEPFMMLLRLCKITKGCIRPA